MGVLVHAFPLACPELDVFAARADPASSSAPMRARGRNGPDGFEPIELRTRVAFPNVVLRPLILAAALIPEARTSAMPLAALPVIVIVVVRSGHRRSAAQWRSASIDAGSRQARASDRHDPAEIPTETKDFPRLHDSTTAITAGDASTPAREDSTDDGSNRRCGEPVFSAFPWEQDDV